MKTTGITLLAVVVFAIQGLAQGTINFANSSSSRIYDGSSGFLPGPLVSDTNYHVGLYFNLDTNTVALSSFQFGSSLLAVTSISGIFPGRFLGGTVAVPGISAGDYIAAQILVWKGPYATFQDMLNAGVYDSYGNCIGGACDPRGYSLPFLVGPLAGSTPLSNLQSFSLISAPIPEPSSVLLAGLASICLALFARRR